MTRRNIMSAYGTTTALSGNKFKEDVLGLMNALFLLFDVKEIYDEREIYRTNLFDTKNWGFSADENNLTFPFPRSWQRLRIPGSERMTIWSNVVKEVEKMGEEKNNLPSLSITIAKGTGFTGEVCNRRWWVANESSFWMITLTPKALVDFFTRIETVIRAANTIKLPKVDRPIISDILNKFRHYLDKISKEISPNEKQTQSAKDSFTATLKVYNETAPGKRTQIDTSPQLSVTKDHDNGDSKTNNRHVAS